MPRKLTLHEANESLTATKEEEQMSPRAQPTLGPEQGRRMQGARSRTDIPPSQILDLKSKSKSRTRSRTMRSLMAGPREIHKEAAEKGRTHNDDANGKVEPRRKPIEDGGKEGKGKEPLPPTARLPRSVELVLPLSKPRP